MQSISIGLPFTLAPSTFYAMPAASVRINYIGSIYSGFGNGTNGLSVSTFSGGQNSVISAPYIQAPSGATITLTKDKSSKYLTNVIKDGASNYWRLGESSGTTAKDVVGGANGTISGGVTLNQAGATSDGDKAMSFNGTTGGIANTVITVPQSATIEAWIKSTAFSGYQAVFSTRGGPNGFMLCLSGTDVACYRDAATPIEVDAGVVLVAGSWYHLALVRNATTTILYVNGTSYTRAQTHLASGPGPWAISDPGNGNPFNGSLDEVAIYPYALSAAQIKSHYDAGRS